MRAGSLKFNPFQPNGLISPGIFTGRLDEIRAIEHALFQAKHGNPVHFMIQGERGIGKSSLFYVSKLTASGTLATMSGETLKFLVVSVDLGGTSTQLDIVRTIGRELKDVVGSSFREKAKAFWEWATNWEILGVRYHRETAAFNPQDASDDLISHLSSLCAQLAA
jgi:Cdc6-like AAA superfamily ATPase